MLHLESRKKTQKSFSCNLSSFFSDVILTHQVHTFPRKVAPDEATGKTRKGLLTTNPELCLHRCAGDQRLLEIPSSCCRVSGNNPAITYFDD